MTQNEKVTARVRASFEKQKIMRLLGATLTGVEPGQVEITLPFREEADAATWLSARRGSYHHPG